MNVYEAEAIRRTNERDAALDRAGRAEARCAELEKALEKATRQLHKHTLYQADEAMRMGSVLIVKEAQAALAGGGKGGAA